MRRPNILLISSDQQHFDTLGAVNPRIRTPALDRLCREGTRFDRAYCSNPTCTPSRASIITGTYPSVHGAWAIGVKTPEELPTVGATLSESGYSTALIGKAHFQPLASQPGCESLESQPTLRDLDFWRRFHGPWYGFDHVELARNHADEGHVGQHYAIWMEERGLTNWREYFDAPGAKPGSGGRKHGWDLPEEYHYSAWTAERTISFIREAAPHSAERPFFAWASFHDPHPPYLVPESWASMYDPAEMSPGALLAGEHDRNPPHFRLTQEPEPDFGAWHRPHFAHGCHSHLQEQEELKREVATYYGMVSLMDHHIGRVLDELDRQGLTEDTLVVFTSDHGHFLGQHGLTAKGPFHYEDLIRVPLIVRWPGRVPSGSRSSALQSLIDLAPSFLTAAGAPVPAVTQGVSQLEVWQGAAAAARDHAICENRHNPVMPHLRTYVDERHKLTVYREGDFGELFDLAEDPYELTNLWDEPGAASLKQRLLQRFLQATLASEPLRMPRIAPA
jgi:arylsulfatase A-like enzyme